MQGLKTWGIVPNFGVTYFCKVKAFPRGLLLCAYFIEWIFLSLLRNCLLKCLRVKCCTQAQQTLLVLPTGCKFVVCLPTVPWALQFHCVTHSYRLVDVPLPRAVEGLLEVTVRSHQALYWGWASHIGSKGCVCEGGKSHTKTLRTSPLCLVSGRRLAFRNKNALLSPISPSRRGK